jgi:hypothetical protein
MEDYFQQGYKVINSPQKSQRIVLNAGNLESLLGGGQDCETNAMREHFPYWTSENKEIDELIRHTQLNASQTCDYLEWIPFDKFFKW